MVRNNIPMKTKGSQLYPIPEYSTTNHARYYNKDYRIYRVIQEESALLWEMIV